MDRIKLWSDVRAIRALSFALGLVLCAGAVPRQVLAQLSAVPAPDQTAPATTGTPVPLLSMATLHFLEGTWTATSRDGKSDLGTYSFVAELGGHILARHSAVDVNCDPVKQPACARRDLFYVYQDSAGAPLKAISFDNEGHVVHYFVTLAVQEAVSTMGRRDFVIFDSDPAQLGARVRLRYVHNVDTQTGRDVLNGSFEMLQEDGRWLVLQQWFGIRR